MADWDFDAPVVVGIDGSDAALAAVDWAVGEARARGTELRLVHAVDIAANAHDERDPGIGYAEQALRTAGAFVESCDPEIPFEAVVADGEAASVLIAESVNAQLVCVGSTGIDRIPALVLGSTAADVATGAHCDVAIIRPHPAGWSARTGCVAFVVPTAGLDNLVVHTAITAARRHHVDVCAIVTDEVTQLVVGELCEEYPDVRIRSAHCDRGLIEFLARHREPIRTVVIGAEDADDVAAIVGPHSDVGTRTGQYSVLVARPVHSGVR